MHIELTEQERLLAQQGQPVDVIDPTTNEAYVLVARQHFEQECTQLPPQAEAAEQPEQAIPEGIRISQEAFRRDLPELLKQKRLFRQWIAYHRNERIGIARDGETLLNKCLERGLANDDYYLGWIDACELIEEEEIEIRLHHCVGFDDDDS
jgi:hypothetical protein